jgi:hypothetical protein
LHDLIKIIKHNILGEVIQIYSDHVVAQCFENTINLRINERVQGLNEALSMELAPGLLGNIFDGIGMIKLILLVFKEGKVLLKQGFLIDDVKDLDTVYGILRINYGIRNEDFYLIENIKKNLLHEIETLKLLHGAFKRK